MPLEPIKLWGFGVLINMRTAQSGTRSGDFCPHKPAALWLWEHIFPFLWNTGKAYWSRMEQTSAGQIRLAQNGADQWSTKWTSKEQSWAIQPEMCLALGLTLSSAVSTAILYQNWAVLHQIKFPSSPHPKLGITVVMNWKQQLSVDSTVSKSLIV